MVTLAKGKDARRTRERERDLEGIRASRRDGAGALVIVRLSRGIEPMGDWCRWASVSLGSSGADGSQHLPPPPSLIEDHGVLRYDHVVVVQVLGEDVVRDVTVLVRKVLDGFPSRLAVWVS